MAAQISQIFILNLRGDRIVARDYRSDIVRNADEVFFCKYTFWNSKVPKNEASESPFFSPRFVKRTKKMITNTFKD